MIKTIFILFLITACDFKNKVPTTNDTQKDNQQKENPGITYDILPLNEPNRYSIRLKWNISNNEIWTLYKEEEGKPTILLNVVYSYEKEFTDSKIEAGKKYRYFLSCANETEKLSTNLISIPVDIELNNRPIRGIIETNRIFMRGKILTEGQDIRIKANEIISQDAIIDSSPLQQKLQEGEKGKNCGSTFIFSNRLIGNISIYCKAMDGAIGKTGENGEMGKNGEKGENGTFTKRFKAPPFSAPMSFEQYLEQVRRGLDFTPEWYSQRFICTKSPENGSPGWPGYDGKDGYKGGDGGDSGVILIKINEESTFKVETDINVGNGGPGGQGGAGGKGGIGGKAGDLEPEVPKKAHKYICPPAKDGINGPDGKPGRKGPNGEKGKFNLVCIKIGEKLKGDCHFFGIYE